MIPKAELEHGAYYQGHCRNARVARWNAENERFYYWRSKWERTYVMRLPHEEDQRGFDSFQPHRKIGFWGRLILAWKNTRYRWIGRRIQSMAVWLCKQQFDIPFRSDAGDDG